MSGPVAHPDDVAYVDSLLFTVSPLQPFCGCCVEPAPTTVVGGVDTNSGAGFDDRRCRACILKVRAQARAIVNGTAVRRA